MKLSEFVKESQPIPSGALPMPGTPTFDDKMAWMEAVQEHGADEFLKEKEFNLDLIYAVGNKGGRLKGTWSDNRSMGVLYKGKKGQGLDFSKGFRDSKRHFYKAVM